MPASIDCYLCLLRQSLEAARFASEDPEIHRQVILSGMKLIHESEALVPPPLLGREIHRLIRQVTGTPDPYSSEKEIANRTMLDRLDLMRQMIDSSSDPLETAVKLAITGNLIDNAMGVWDTNKIHQALDEAVTGRLNGSIETLREAIQSADTIFYLTDNAGEIVCDRLLIEVLTQKNKKTVTVAVRGYPIINDATYADAKTAGLTTLPSVEVINNGNDGLGTILDECSPIFLEHFTGDSLVISKGLANFETLVVNTSSYQPKQIIYLFKSKCPFISHFAGTQLGDMVIRTSCRQ